MRCCLGDGQFVKKKLWLYKKKQHGENLLLGDRCFFLLLLKNETASSCNRSRAIGQGPKRFIYSVNIFNATFHKSMSKKRSLKASLKRMDDKCRGRIDSAGRSNFIFADLIAFLEIFLVLN